MYVRQYKLKCRDKHNMDRFRIVTTQGKTFAQLMKNYSVRLPGFIEAVDDHVDNESWEITTKWESKVHFEESQKHPYRKMFWNKFEVEALKHDISLLIIDGDTGQVTNPFDFLED
jgi:heme-degrading monooxygenase HmoA